MRILFLFFLIISGSVTVAQKKQKPTIVILDPFHTKYDSILLSSINDYTFQNEYTPQEERHILDSFSKSKRNIQIMDVAEFHFRKKMDFASHFTLMLNAMLTYMVFGETENCIVIPSHDKSEGTIEALKSVAKKHNVQWVVNPVKLYTYMNGDNIFTAARIQVYDLRKNKIVLDKEYLGNSRNPGFELSCETGTIECTVNNVIGPSLHDILLTILKSYQH